MRLRVARPAGVRDPFHALWLGQSVSALGTQVSMVALPLIAVLSLRVGALELGVLAALETVPYLLLSLPAGVLLDRVDRRRTMIVCDVGRALALIVAAGAMALGVLSIGILYVVALAVGSLTVFFTVAYASYLAEIVPAGGLVAGNQRLEMSESGARIAGPSLGGTILQVAGGATAVFLDAMSYLVSAVAIGASRRPSGHRRASTTEIGLVAGMAGGLRQVLGDRVLRDLAGSTAIFNLGSGMMLAVVVLFATHEVGLDAAGFGLVYGLGNVGFMLGAVAIGAMSNRFGIGRTFAWSSYASALAMVLIAVAGGGPGVLFLLAGRFAGAVATPIYNVNALSLRQARVGEAIMGRVNGTFQFIEWGVVPVGSLLGGILAAGLGPRPALAAAALCGVVSAVWVGLSPASHFRTLGDGRLGTRVDGAAQDDADDGRGTEKPDPPLVPPLVA